MASPEPMDPAVQNKRQKSPSPPGAVSGGAQARPKGKARAIDYDGRPGTVNAPPHGAYASGGYGYTSIEQPHGGTTNEQYMTVPGTQGATHPYGDNREGPASFVDGKGNVTNVPGLLPYPKVETCSECKR